MTNKTIPSCLLAGLLFAGVSASYGQDNPSEDRKVDRASAYYYFALGHLYSELVSAYGNKGSFVDNAIDNYRLAMDADPNASFLSEELTDLYIQAGRLREAVLDAESALKENPNDIGARRMLARIYTRLIGESKPNQANEEMVQKAVEQYEKITELKPDDERTWFILGRLYKLEQDSVKSEAAYKKVLEINPENEDALVGLAMVYSDLGDQPRAAEALNRVVGNNPTIGTLTFLAATYEKMDNYALAAETYRKAMKVSPGNPEVMRSYAQNQLRAGELDEALKVYGELAAADPKDSESNLRRAQILRERGKLAEAREALDAAKEASPDNLEIQYYNVGLLEAEDRSEEAIAVLKEILSSTERTSYSAGERSNRAIFLERLGLMYRSVDRPEEAVAVFRQLEELDAERGARVVAQIADTYRQAKDYDRASEEIERALEKYPDDRVVAVMRATILADTDHPDEAIAVVQKLTSGKDDRESRFTRAQIYEKTKRYDLMAEELEALLAQSRTNDEKSSVLFMSGAMYERQKRYDEAESAFRKVLELDPDNSSAMNYLGYMFADRNVKLEEALQLIKRALEYDPANGAYLDSLGWVYYRMDRLPEAEETLLIAAQKVRRDPVVHDHLGDVYFGSGKLREAIAQWKVSLREWKTSPASEKDLAQMASVQKKLEGAEVQLASESTGAASKEH